jgi:tetratricopeptide (TPR) repeat protein
MLDTAERTTRITTSRGSGSGYVIAPRLVLTSAHAVPETGGQVRVHTATDHQPYDGEVAWRGTPHGHDDAALVHITGPGWAERAVSTRWGRLVTTAPGTPCEVWGFPDLVQRPGRAAETAQLVGTVAPGTHFVNHRHVMDLSAHPPRWYPHEVDQQQKEGVRRSLWAGLSGAALRCGDGEHLVGVVAADPEHRDHTALEVVPAYVLHHDPAFRAVLAEHGVPLRLEPVELAHLADTALDFADHLSPAFLLEAQRRVVAFHGRDQAMADLVSWATSGPRIAVKVVHGPGGQGKTRLAHELTRHLNAPEHWWSTVWVSGHTGPQELEVVKDTTVPSLLVLDYAEARTGQIAAVLHACARRRSATPVRLLLLARTVGEWWEQANTAASHTLAGLATLDYLPSLTPHIPDRRSEYRTAVQHLVHALPRTGTAQDWERIASRLPDPVLEGPEWDTVLSVHLRALADLLDTAHPGPAAPPGVSVEDRVLSHETRYWQATAADHGLHSPELRQPLRDALAMAFTLTASTQQSADDLVAAVPALADQPAARRLQVRRWIASLYPAREAGVWGQLQPDRLLERFLGRRLTADPALFDPYLDTITPADAERLVTLYTRAAAHPALADLAEQLTRLCTRYMGRLGPTVIDVAAQVENPHPIIQALETTTADPGTPTSILRRLNGALPLSSQRLAVWAERLTARLVEVDRERTAQDPGTYLPDLAKSLNNQAVRLADLGRFVEALDSITEAVQHYRALAEQHPDAHLPDLAASLNNQAADLGDLGRTEEALDSITEAVQHYRALAEQHPDAHLPDLAMSLNNQAVRLGDLRRFADALNAVAEAVRIRRTLAKQRPDAHLPDLATCLNNQAINLNGLGRFAEALDTVAEAVRIRRTLAKQRPDAHLPDLAMSLNSQSNCLGELGRGQEALETITEAVEYFRALADQRPDAHLPDLAVSLNNQATHLDALGRTEEALEAITEAVEYFRALADQRPDAHLPDLAVSLNNQATHLDALGRTEEALEAITEAVDIRSALAEKRPAAHQDGLERSLRLLEALRNPEADQE